MNTDPHSDLDPDIADHLAREAAFENVFAWPPMESATDARPRFVLQPWSIDRESALRALTPHTLGDSSLDTALTALWLAAHDDDAITLLRIQSPARQIQTLRDWSRAHVLVSERDVLIRLVDDIFRAADENKTIPAHEGSASAGNA